jgi:Leucine-rich repeat (LRR) protein
LWRIPDSETASLMGAFFDRLAEDSVPGADTLRQAQLITIRARRDKAQCAHPFYWAAFTLTTRGTIPLGRPLDPAGLRAEVKRHGGVAIPHAAELHRLRWLDLERTAVTDGWFVNLREQDKLEVLLLYGSHLGDEGIAHLRHLSELRELDLRGTRVTDKGLIHLKGLSNLRVLKLGHRITDAGLAVLKELPNLEVLYCPHGITGTGLEVLKELPRLRELHVRFRSPNDTEEGGDKEPPDPDRLRWTKLVDAGLVHIVGCKSLEVLDLSDNLLVDEHLAQLTGLTNLTSLNLEHTVVTDQGMKHLKELKRLRYLNLFQTAVSDEAVKTLQKERPDLRVKQDAETLTEQMMAVWRLAIPKDGNRKPGLDTFDHNKGTVQAVAYSPDGKLLASAGGSDSSGRGKRIRVSCEPP